ncbi:nuclear transport factor 2 family protein [Streptomyces flaveolus]|uniref:nuclear transport factor 2 family protein n=1 Tax=Streptomyces flaveolus TaxID=67297 RepID=UPI0033C15C35
MISKNVLVRKSATAAIAVLSVASMAGLAPTTASAATAAPAAMGLISIDAEHTSPATLNHNKRVAVRVLTQLFEEGNLAVANEYVRSDLIQHSPVIADGRVGLKAFVQESRQLHPDQTYAVTRVIAQGDLVLVHANPIHEPGTRGTAVMTILRFDEKGKIAEYWDTVQDVPATTVNGNDMFGTVSNPDTNQPSGPSKQTALSQEVVTSYFNTLLVEKNPDAVDYLTPEFYQHNPVSPSGSAGLREQFAQFFQAFPDTIAELNSVIAEKDYVAIHFRYRLSPAERGQSIMGIFRVTKQTNGEYKIIEHWDVHQEIPATSANDNTMF